MSKKRPWCPQCQSKKVVPILYGMPTDAAVDDAAAGKIAIGGCCVNEQSPKWHCQACEHEFGKYMLNANDVGEGDLNV